MRLDLRIVLPAALAAGAILVPATSSANHDTHGPPNQGHCPNGFIGPFPIAAVMQNKDTNDNGQLCVKEKDMKLVFKDDNCNPNCDKDDLTLIAPLLTDSYTDDIEETVE